MALYEYECGACGQRFELIQRFSDLPADVCKLCGKGPVHKLISAPAIQFKGTGWYITDYARKGDSAFAASSSADSAPAPASSSPATSSSAPSAESSGSRSEKSGSSSEDGSASKPDSRAKSDKSSSSSDAGSASKPGSSGTGKA